MKKTKINKKLFNKKLYIIIAIILLLYCVGGILYSALYKNKKSNINSKKLSGVTIKNYDYLLYDDDMDIYKTEFKALKKNLESSTINFQEYATSVAKMFLIDLYSLDEKLNMYDVGGSQFVYPSSVVNYKLNVQNTLYKYMKSNDEGTRKQELPLVKNVTIKNQEEFKYSIGEEEFDAYKIELDIEYDKDLQYDKEAEVVLIKKDNYIYVVEKN